MKAGTPLAELGEREPWGTIEDRRRESGRQGAVGEIVLRCERENLDIKARDLRLRATELAESAIRLTAALLGFDAGLGFAEFVGVVAEMLAAILLRNLAILSASRECELQRQQYQDQQGHEFSHEL